MRFKDAELKAVLASVEADLQKAYESAKGELLAKAAPEDETPPGEASDEAVSASPPAPEASESEAAESPAPESAPSADASASPEAPPAPEGSQDQDPAQDAPLSPEALQAEYSQLSPEELDTHIKAALAAKEALAGMAGPDAGAPPQAGPPAPEAPPMAPPAMKAEMKDNKANGGVIKSEPEVDTNADKVKELESVVKSQAEDIENLTKAVKMVLERPVRKAVTSLADIQKSEPRTYSPAEAQARLKAIIPTLNKSERELVLGYYEGRVPVESLAAVFDKVK